MTSTFLIYKKCCTLTCLLLVNVYACYDFLQLIFVEEIEKKNKVENIQFLK